MVRIVRVIDRGGFGIVQEAKLAGGQRVARKTFDPQIGTPEEREKLKRRFVREVRIQSQIDHPNIMPILEHNLEDSPPWFTMPLASRSFAKQIEEDRTAGAGDAKSWQDILAAVEELHRLGFVHRDLKPANILLLGDRWVLSDFGLVLPLTRDTTILTSSKSAYGSHYYAAPEQARDFRNTPEQADIFALGCILHDATDPHAARVPFAQIRVAGPYGAVLEKCTEVDPRRRFPTIAALRAALFDLWRTAQSPAPTRDEAALLEAVMANPAGGEEWRDLLAHLENISFEMREPVLKGVNAELILHLSKTDDVLFGRLMRLLCSWASGTWFEFSYCDVVGDRLLEAYRIATVRIRVQIVSAALELAVSHNRWKVMGQVGAMLGPAAENGLVDRLLIEMKLDSGIEGRLRAIERVIHWPRTRWHERIAKALTERDT